MEDKKRVLLCLNHLCGEEAKYVDEAISQGWTVPLGPDVDAFERDLEKYIGKGKKVLAVSAGTAALHLGLIGCGVKEGDEVIVQSMTFSASANPVKYCGAMPVFVDSEAGTYNMDPALLERAIVESKSRTGRYPAAIVAVDLYGMPAHYEEICAVAEEYDIPVVEDSAEAMGSEYKGEKCGTFGDYGVLSFNGNKMITTSGGGALICPDEESRRKALYFATQAREGRPWYQHEHIGYNYRLSNISAAIGRGQLHCLEEHLAHHRRIHRLYAEMLADVAGVSLHSNPDADFDSNYWLSTILLDRALAGDVMETGATGRGVENLRQALAGENIESRPLWKPMHMQPVFADCLSYVSGVSQDLFERGLCLPSGPCVDDGDVERIVGIISNFLKKQR